MRVSFFSSSFCSLSAISDFSDASLAAVDNAFSKAHEADDCEQSRRESHQDDDEGGEMRSGRFELAVGARVLVDAVALVGGGRVRRQRKARTVVPARVAGTRAHRRLALAVGAGVLRETVAHVRFVVLPVLLVVAVARAAVEARLAGARVVERVHGDHGVAAAAQLRRVAGARRVAVDGRRRRRIERLPAAARRAFPDRREPVRQPATVPLALSQTVDAGRRFLRHRRQNAVRRETAAHVLDQRVHGEDSSAVFVAAPVLVRIPARAPALVDFAAEVRRIATHARTAVVSQSTEEQELRVRFVSAALVSHSLRVLLGTRIFRRRRDGAFHLVTAHIRSHDGRPFVRTAPRWVDRFGVPTHRRRSGDVNGVASDTTGQVAHLALAGKIVQFVAPRSVRRVRVSTVVAGFISASVGEHVVSPIVVPVRRLQHPRRHGMPVFVSATRPT